MSSKHNAKSERKADMERQDSATGTSYEARHDFYNFFKLLKLGAYQTTPDGRVLAANPALLKLLGYSSIEEFAEHHLEGDDFVPSYEQGNFKEQLHEEGRIFDMEAVWRRRDGSHIVVRENAWVVRDEEGKILRYEGTVEDITENRQVERALREKEERYRQTFHNSPNAIFSIDGEGLIETWNSACQTVFQYDETMVGQPYQMLCADEQQIAAAEKMVAQVFQNQRLSGVEMSYRAKDGSLRYTVSRLYPLLDDKGAVQFCVFANTDISERKEAETALWRRERILQSVTFAAERLLGSHSWEDVVEEVLSYLGRATNVSRVYLFQNLRDAAGVERIHQRFEWAADGVAPQVDNPAVQELDWEAVGLERWRDLLSEGSVVQGPVSGFQPAEREFLEMLDVRSTVLVPVFVGRAWWGCLGFSDCKVEREWSPSEVDALRAAANMLGNAIARRRVERELRRRNQELTLLNRVIAAATTTLEPYTVLQTACRELASAFGVPQAGVALLDESGTALQVVAEYVADQAPSALGEHIPIKDNAATQHVLERREPLVIADAQNDPRMTPVHELMQQRQVSSMLLLPLIAEEHVVGTLALDSREPYYFGQDEVDLAMSVVVAVTQVLEKARLLTAEQENAARLEEILQLGTELATVRDEKQLLQRLVDRAAAFADSSTCTVFLLDESSDEAVLVAQSGLTDDVLELRVPLTLAPLRKALQSNEPVIIGDVDRDVPELRNFLVRSDVHAFYAYPIVGDGGPVGFITFSDRSPRTPPPAEVNALRLLADRVAAALQNVRLIDAVSQQATELTALHEVDLAITTSLEPEEVYATIVESAARLLRCDVINLFRWDASTEAFEGLATFGARQGNVKGEYFAAGSSGIMPDLIQNPKPIAIPDAREDVRVTAAWRERFGVRAALVVPLLFREKLIGFLVAITVQVREWSAADIALAESLAAQAAIAVTNARLHAETRHLLHQSRQQARIVQQIVDTVPEGLLLLDTEGQVVLANPMAQAYLPLLGVVEDEAPLTLVGGRSLSDLLKPPAEGKLFHEVVVARPERRVFEVSAQAMEAGPQAGGWVLMLRDATKEREQQAYLQAQDRLATVGQLAAGIAHDFNNIMAVIVLYAQALQRSEDIGEKDRERLGAIYLQARRASSLIAQILDFSRNSVVERHPLDLRPFLKELVQLLRRMLPETMSIELYEDQDSSMVEADPTRLQQALMNLAVNARDAMPGGGRFSLKLEHLGPDWTPTLPDMEPGSWIHLTVHDSGGGIPDEHLDHIFEPFYTTKEPGQGAGLGLAQVYGIVKQHDGFIDVSSDPEQGTTFHLYLPMLQLPAHDSFEEEQFVESANGETLLVVEDEVSIREAIREILELLNYRVLLAEDGQEALDLYRQEGDDISLVLSDMVMPRMDGAALYRALQKENPDVKMLMFTGYPLDAGGKQFVEESGVPWIQKPFTRDDIGRLIRRLIGNQESS